MSKAETKQKIVQKLKSRGTTIINLYMLIRLACSIERLKEYEIVQFRTFGFFFCCKN